jgi:Flp pilus assembly protein TadG
MHKKSKKQRSERGDLVIELAVGSFLFLVFSLMSFDLGLLVFCAELNDRACRDAARAAAQGSDLTTATRLAKAALLAHSPIISYMSQPTIQGAVNYVDFGGNPPNTQTAPYVQVTTSTLSQVPTGPVQFLGAKFLPCGKATFVQTYTFPIIKTK